MNINDIIELGKMGFTAAQVMQLAAMPAPAPAQQPDAFAVFLAQMQQTQQQMTQTLQQIQQANLYGAQQPPQPSVQDQAQAALAAIINPPAPTPTK